LTWVPLLYVIPHRQMLIWIYTLIQKLIAAALFYYHLLPNLNILLIIDMKHTMYTLTNCY